MFFMHTDIQNILYYAISCSFRYYIMIAGLYTSILETYLSENVIPCKNYTTTVNIRSLLFEKKKDGEPRTCQEKIVSLYNLIALIE